MKCSPIQKLALQFLSKDFSDLFTANSQITMFYHELIESVYDMAFWGGQLSLNWNDWNKTIRAAYRFLDDGALYSAKKVNEAYFAIIELIWPALNFCCAERKQIDKNYKQNNMDGAILAVLHNYVTICERLLTVILAPIIYAFRLRTGRGKIDKVFCPRADGKINLVALDKMEKFLHYPQNRLAIGLNRHIRNAFSHDNYTILDGSKVRLWDVNPQSGKYSWGPEDWHFEALVELHRKLWLNSLAIIIALCIFGINYESRARDRGWAKPLARPPIRKRDALISCELNLDRLGFIKKRMEIIEETFEVDLKIRERGEDHEEKYLVETEDGYEEHILEVKYCDFLVMDHLIDFCVFASNYLPDIANIKISVKDHQDDDIGIFIIDMSAVTYIGKKGKENISLEQARKLATIDTIGQSVMGVRLERIN